MQHFWQRYGVLVGVVLVALGGAGAAKVARAQKLPPRWREETVTETLYTWWLVPWSSPQQVACVLRINHPENPTPDDIYRFCGWDLYEAWRTTPACQAALQGEDVTSCRGYYLHFVGQKTATHTVIRVYPPPQVHLSLGNCVPDLPHFHCPETVTVHITADEPLPDAHITAIQVYVPGRSAMRCPGEGCDVSLEARSTPWVYHLSAVAVSSAPQSNHAVAATLRLTPAADGGTIVDVLSDAWDDEGADMCAQAWQAMPPVKNLPAWARTPASAKALATDEPYVYLAGRLIAHRVVDASDCPSRGLQPNGVATACGLAKARAAVTAWQNRFDPQIWEAARRVGVPAVLFKRLLARESQFWPGHYPKTYEVGFGQLSPQGMDTLLMWDPALFLNMCRTMLGAWKCTHGYDGLALPQRNFLYGSLWVQADLTCNDCPFGVDMHRVPASLTLFARLLRANCRQTGQTVLNLTGRQAGNAAAYTDLWRFTLAEYNSPDCLYEALKRTIKEQGVYHLLDWPHVREHFPPGCEATRHYVEDILPP